MVYNYTIITIVTLAIFNYTTFVCGATKGDITQQKVINSRDDTKISSDIRKKTSIKNYTAIIMADPQAWSLGYGGPNSKAKRARWISKNEKIAKAIKSHKAAFHIVNGDLTEFGRKKTYDDYANIYKKLGSPVYEGLGNHDYANNVGNCTIPEEMNSSSDACAISAISRMLREMKEYSDKLPHFNQDITENLTGTSNTSVHFIEGSFGYSWDYGNIHYVQLHNYPTYTVNLKQHDINIHVKSSLDWLKKDLAAADARGKITIMNFHDARPFYRDGYSRFLKPEHTQDLSAFKSIITSHNVKAIFAGHTHYQSYCRAQNDKVFGNIPVYTAGALFRGDYYLINVQGKDIHVKAYNGRTGKPTLIEDLGMIGTNTKFFESCSNL
ncbi:metallophosphoesterase [Bartonella refiksaydamii]|uniref:metallophosphoesterase n=1 Tax=Bartonella refiksaydamii TaxID=2654951 RepID=UPI0012EC8E97|nr:metallophosphoesterase [Bartonella refiksaydamii]